MLTRAYRASTAREYAATCFQCRSCITSVAYQAPSAKRWSQWHRICGGSEYRGLFGKVKGKRFVCRLSLSRGLGASRTASAHRPLLSAINCLSRIKRPRATTSSSYARFSASDIFSTSCRIARDPVGRWCAGHRLAADRPCSNATSDRALHDKSNRGLALLSSSENPVGRRAGGGACHRSIAPSAEPLGVRAAILCQQSKTSAIIWMRRISFSQPLALSVAVDLNFSAKGKVVKPAPSCNHPRQKANFRLNIQRIIG